MTPKRYRTIVTEMQFQSQVTEFAQMHGWRVFSLPDSRRVSHAGFPDLTLWHPGRREFFFAELKTVKGVVSEFQSRVHQELIACGMEVVVWRPQQWPEIEDRLGKTKTWESA